MPQGKEFSKEEKVLLFRVIAFADSEKYGPKIPMYNVIDQLQVMLGISRQTIMNLRQEMSRLMAKQSTLEQETLLTGSKALQQRQLRSVKSENEAKSTSPGTVGREEKRWWTTSSTVTIVDSTTMPSPMTPKNKGNSGRKRIILTGYEEDLIRYQFHVLLASKQYPTTAKLLFRLLEDTPDFPTQSESTLLRYMHQFGFRYKRTAKISIPLDTTSFIASPSSPSFRHLNDPRSANVAIYYHDETWTNSGVEQRYLWVDENGEGRLRKNEGRGPRLAISALISEKGFHLSTVEIFKFDVDHNMCSDHFIKWMERTCLTLRDEHGK